MPNLQQLKQQALSKINNAQKPADIDRLRNKYLSRKKGLLTKVLHDLADLTIEQKKQIDFKIDPFC